MDPKELEMRIVELENQLKELAGARQPAEISPEEIKAYMKVRDTLRADWGDFCGINDCGRCIVFRCGGGSVPIFRCIRVCDVECSCGPCGFIGGGFAGGGTRFGGLGG